MRPEWLTTKDTKSTKGTKVGPAFLPVHRVGGLNRQAAKDTKGERFVLVLGGNAQR